ncbi:MAG: peptide chain release factor 2 [Kiritimatiellae bacterium]|nr:peptide chain release factor 2 [Kiritimatiellia bacterium]
MLEAEEVRQRLADLQKKTGEMAEYIKISERRARLKELEDEQAKGDFWSNQAKAREVIAMTNAERAYVGPYDSLLKTVEDASVMLELAGMETGDALQSALADTLAECAKADVFFSKLRLQSLLGGKFDQCNVFVKLHAGQGGTEACDWVQMLYRMYQRYAEMQGWKVEEYDEQPGEEAGLKDVYFRIEGPYAFGMLKAERGIHRLVRISPFDANKRRQTSFASVETVAEINDDIDVEIKDEDLRIDTYRSGGAGGQHVNKTDSAVRLTHLPTGIVVACQKERSQHMNKEKAMNMLRAQLYEYYEDQKKAEMDRFYGAKSENGWGSQIRSYVFCPYTMVKDLRTQYETSDVNGVMDGNVQPFIEAWLQMKAAGK